MAIISERKTKRFAKHLLFALILCILSILVFSLILWMVVSENKILFLDFLINQSVSAFHGEIITWVMIFFTNIISPFVFAFLLIVLLFVFVYMKKFYSAVLLFFSILAGFLSGLLIKFLVYRLRPANVLIEFSGSSFPSGHATMAVIFFSLVIYSFKYEIKNKFARYLFIVCSILLFLIIGFSRIYLNVHWFSDVIAGFFLGIFWLTLLILLFKIVNLDKIIDKKFKETIQAQD